MVVNIIFNFCYTRVLLYVKMLKETESEERIDFLSHFYNWCHFNTGTDPWDALATPMQSTHQLKKYKTEC